jgi:hypothetical protein
VNSAYFKIDENGTLNATKQDKNESIACSVLKLFMGSNGHAYYCHRRLDQSATQYLHQYTVQNPPQTF